MSRITIDQLREIGDLASVYRWNLSIAKFPSGSTSWPSSDDLDVRCETTTIPKLTGTSIETNIRGHKIKSPGIYNYDNVLTLTFIETVDNKIQEFINTWKELCWETKTGKAKPKKDIEAIIHLKRLDNEDNEIYLYELIGSFYEDSDGGTLDGSTSDVIKPSLTISYDYFKESSLK